MQCRAEDQVMCETSEPNEQLLTRGEFPLAEIGLRLQEAFDYDSVPEIAVTLRFNTDDVTAVVEGRTLPTAELLLGVRKVTGISADWILTGEGPKFVAGPALDRYNNRPLPVWAITQLESIRRAA